MGMNTIVAVFRSVLRPSEAVQNEGALKSNLDIFSSFYLNSVCKNIVCDVGLGISFNLKKELKRLCRPL